MSFQVGHSAIFKRFTRLKSFAVSRLARLGLTGSYFSNPMLHGAPARIQIDSAVDFEWTQVICCDVDISKRCFSHDVVAFQRL
jgi:hypothetical protein